MNFKNTLLFTKLKKMSKKYTDKFLIMISWDMDCFVWKPEISSGFIQFYNK